MVVPVLMTSCQVSLNPNSGPLQAQRMITLTAAPKAIGRPAILAALLANRVNQEGRRPRARLLRGAGATVSIGLGGFSAGIL